MNSDAYNGYRSNWTLFGGGSLNEVTNQGEIVKAVLRPDDIDGPASAQCRGQCCALTAAATLYIPLVGGVLACPFTTCYACMIQDAERIRQRQQTLILTDRAVLLHQPAQGTMFVF
eukprot:m.1354304 g.1354304  ORF g.1354304 m.1354304 type:complete len:116 (+) comp24931_c1_seq32:259-606(+)